MRQKNLLTLHEAIAVVLLKFPDWNGSFTDVAAEIEQRGLYSEREGNVELATQCFLRAKNYPHLFELQGREFVKLRFKTK